MTIKKIKKYITFYKAYSKGKMQEVLGDYNLAYRAYLFAVAVKSDFIGINNAIIRTARKTRQFGVASDFADAAIRKFPEHSDFYAQKAEILRLMKDYDKASEYYEKACQIDDTKPEYYVNNAKIKYYTGDVKSAIRICNVGLSKHEKSESLFKSRAFYNFEDKNYKSAVDDYTKAMALCKGNKYHLYFMRAASKILSGENADYDISVSERAGYLINL